ncbi:MAG: hypothetical protein ACJA04_000240 [Cellvibrionaceae bacterium]|jgi:hypothetical protein
MMRPSGGYIEEGQQLSDNASVILMEKSDELLSKSADQA